MSETRYFWKSQYHWGVPNPEVDLVIQQYHHISSIQQIWWTLYLSIRSVSRVISRYHRESLLIRCRVWHSSSHPAANDGEFIGYHSIRIREGESQDFGYVIQRILQDTEETYFYTTEGISSPWSGNHTPTPEPHSPLPSNFQEATPAAPPTPPEEHIPSSSPEL